MPSFDLRSARDHARTAGTALVNWWRAVSIEALCVAILWWIGLTLLGIPLAPVWALIGGLMTFVPNFGGVITVIFPVMMVLFSGRDLYRLGFVLGLYAVIVVIDQLLLQPWLLKRVTRVPIWASIFVPIALGIIIPFWGVLLGPPLLAVVYAFRKPKLPQAIPPSPAWFSPPGRLIAGQPPRPSAAPSNQPPDEPPPATPPTTSA